MIGTIIKENDEWFIRYPINNNIERILLHPNDLWIIDHTGYISGKKQEVEFKIVKENIDTGALEAPYIEVKYGKIINHTSSQTEISDEEEWAAALKLTDNIQEHNGWEKAIKWYKEKLKKKQ